MRKVMLVLGLTVLAVVLLGISVSALNYPVNHRYSAGGDGVITLGEKWEFKEDVAGRNKGFTLTHSYSVPAEYRQSSFSNFGPYHNSNSFSKGVYASTGSVGSGSYGRGSYGFGGSSYSNSRNYYSSGGYLNSGRVSGFNSIGSVGSSSGALGNAFDTFRADSARRDYIKNRPRSRYYTISTGRYGFGGYYRPYRYYY
jgi:hypothetical protein